MRHPYTQALLGSIPRLESDATKPLLSIPGLPPDLTNPPPGCRFAARCQFATEQCLAEEPPLTGDADHQFSCWHPVDGPAVITKPLIPSRSAAPAVPVSSGANVSVVAEPAPESALATAAAGKPLLEVVDVVREYPVTAGQILRRRVNSVKAVSDVTPDRRPGRGPRTRRRVRLRQDDAGQADRRDREARRRPDQIGW